jgi:NAD-dependent dihydropyrimidine dehydrogenase PreA subunit
MRKTGIRVDPTRCTQCYSCQLRCSYIYSGAFNPEKARIVPNPPNDISFTDECRTGCSACVAYCPTGALMRIR